MPFKDPDPTDPNMLVGVVLEADAGATRDMAYVFAEEFARLGYRREEIFWLFKNPFYGGAHGVYRALGEKETRAIIDECIGVWGNFQVTVQPPGGEDSGGGSNDGLNVLNELNPINKELDDG
ncbi:MAG TPA: hypothetical protein VNO43_03660 [Candidatus Eisenbacteria bacterium]|nr:hypothetical protein [Candidatus Eisenbacteria bacterium]